MALKRHGRRGHRKKRLKSAPKLTDGQKKFLKDTGELHPSETKDGVKKYTQIKDEGSKRKLQIPEVESSSDSEEENPFQQLMCSIGQNTNKFESSESEEEDVAEEHSDENDVAEEHSDDNDDVVEEHSDENEVADENDSEDDADDHEEENDIDENDADKESVDIDDIYDEEDEEEESAEDVEDSDADQDSNDEIENQSLSKKKINVDKCDSEVKNKKSSKFGKDGKTEKGTKRKLESDSEDNDDFPGDDDEDDNDGSSDPFSVHFERDLEEKEADKCLNGSWEKKETKVSQLGRAFTHCKNWDLEMKVESDNSLQDSHVKQSLFEQVAETNRTMCNPGALSSTDVLTPLQQGLFSVINGYQDLYYTERTHQNAEELRLLYCLHALNHVLKSRKKVMTHNSSLKLKKGKSDNDEYRDQGLTRPKVLMILPFRESATKVVNMMSSLLGPAEQVVVSNKKRFKSEFGAEEDQDYRKGLKPEDFESTFSGNNDDHFRLGITVSKRSLKMYVPFYQSDIILSSPLGLRTVIGAEGDKDRDFDFLSSIEMLVMDQTDVFIMQNWDHVLHILRHLHLQPKESHGCDFSRVRMWTLNGWSHLYRQTLIFSGVTTPEINAVFNKHCHNYAGKVQTIRNPGNGIICQIITQTPQTFQRLSCTSFSQLPDARFEFFIKKIVPHHRESVMKRTLVYVPSYFDFVRIRNYFKKESFNFVHMNEYASDRGISRVRCDFYHGKAQFLLYTERLHFYRRFQVRGIKHIIFYELPTYPHFYSEICNMIKDPKRGVENASATCTVLYSKYDAQKLAEVVGAKRASVMLNSEKSVHMFVTGQDS